MHRTLALRPAGLARLFGAGVLALVVAGLPLTAQAADTTGDGDKAKAGMEFRPEIDEEALKELEARLQREYDGARASGKLEAGGDYGKRGKNGKNANPADRADQLNRGLDMIRQFDKDGDGMLDESERKDMGVTLLTRLRDDPAAMDEYIKKWDVNGDGDLSASEEAAAKEAMDKFQGHMEKIQDRITARFDADGDGKLNATEKAAAKEGMEKFRAKLVEGRTKLLKHYDTDGDGKLSDAEKAKIQEDMGKRRRFGKRDL